MLSPRIGALLMSARKQLKLSRPELARRAGVSTRLLAELERGERPNVSLESVLRLLLSVGVTVRLTAPDGAIEELRDPSAVALERAARAAHRRRTWAGGHVRLHDEGEDPQSGSSNAERAGTVTQLSRQAFAIAAAGARRPLPNARTRRKR